MIRPTTCVLLVKGMECCERIDFNTQELEFQCNIKGSFIYLPIANNTTTTRCQELSVM